MKEIKFRSAHYLHGHSDKFSHFSYWGVINHKGDHSVDCFTSPSTSSRSFRKYEDQFTGLKDKNGTEIYEGDIISMSTNKPVAVVVYDYCGFALKWIDKTYIEIRGHQAEPIFRNIHLFTVAGNIHETTD